MSENFPQILTEKLHNEDNTICHVFYIYKTIHTVVKYFSKRSQKLATNIKLYLTNFLELESESTKIYCIHIYLTVNPFT